MGRAGIVAAGVFVALMLIALGVEYFGKHPSVPPPIEARDCLTPPPPDETSNAHFARQGGRITPYPKVWKESTAYTTIDVAQGRNLSRYDKFELADPEPKTVAARWHDPVLAQARTFIWEHWRDRKRGYLLLTLSSVDHTSTSHVFIEPDDSRRWRVYWRTVHRREIVDSPTAYSVKWVIRREWDKPGTSLPEGQVPDPVIHKLEFRDICGGTGGPF
jgi:hypothetical protein